MSKYRAQRTEYNGVMYASRAEAAFAELLDASRMANECEVGGVRFWIPQPKFRLGCPENVYVADFLVVPMSDAVRPYAVDVKGMQTPKFKRDRKLWLKYGPCALHVAKPKYSRAGITFTREIIWPF